MEKHSAVAFDCSLATYKTVTLNDFIYKHGCFPKGWKPFLEHPNVKKEISEISPELAKDAKKYEIEPSMPSMFNAFNVGLDKVKVIILGQDPTPQANKATGMAFSLKPGEDPREVPSVFNMLVELKWEGAEVGLSNGDLTPWVNQGVLLLNAALTVRQGSTQVHAKSHQRLWNDFTALLLQYINEKASPSAWILWGEEAKEAHVFIDRSKHYIKAGGHPRATTAFFGRNYFRCAHEFLVSKGRGEVDWGLPVVSGVATTVEKCDADGL